MNDVGAAKKNRIYSLLKYYWKLLKLFSLLSRTDREYDRQYKKLRQKYYSNIWNTAAEKLGAKIEDIGFGYFKISLNNHFTFVQESSVMIDSHLVLKIAGNKPLSYKLLKDIEGFTVPEYVNFRIENIEKAIGFLKKQDKPVVVKPSKGTGGGKGVTMGVSKTWNLLHSASVARTFGEDLMVEKTISGHSYRLLFLDGEYLQAVRRDPPKLIGDGRATVRQLIKSENERRLKTEAVFALSPLTIDMACTNALREQSIQLNSVIEKDREIIVKYVVNQNASHENHDVTDEVHPDTLEVCKKASKRLKCSLAGVDIISTDISKPLIEVGAVVNEVNTTPGLHHHYLLSDTNKQKDVATMILGKILSVD